MTSAELKVEGLNARVRSGPQVTPYLDESEEDGIRVGFGPRFYAFVAGWCFAFFIATPGDLRWITLALGILNLLFALKGQAYKREENHP